jgi:hypothetical protein
MKTKTLEKWTWILIYVGLAGVGLGLSMRRYDHDAGWAVVAVGALGAVLGVVGILVRSRMKTDPSNPSSESPR